MEEQKTKKVEMKAQRPSNNKEAAEQKLTYEQLNEACSQLYQQNQNLVKQLRQSNLTNMFKRLDYLFEVLKYESVFKDPDFINSCVDEIKESLTIPEENKAKEED